MIFTVAVFIFVCDFDNGYEMHQVIQMVLKMGRPDQETD